LNKRQEWLAAEKAKHIARQEKFTREFRAFKVEKIRIIRKRAVTRRRLKALAKDWGAFNRRKSRLDPTQVPPMIECFNNSRRELRQIELEHCVTLQNKTQAFVDRWERKIRVWIKK
jgi:hypothetical protein